MTATAMSEGPGGVSIAKKAEAAEWLGAAVGEGKLSLPAHAIEVLEAGFEAGCWSMDDVPAEDVVLDKDEIKETFKMWGAFYADSVAVLKVTDSKATSRQGDLVKLEKWISSKYLVQEKIDKACGGGDSSSGWWKRRMLRGSTCRAKAGQA